VDHRDSYILIIKQNMSLEKLNITTIKFKVYDSNFKLDTLIFVQYNFYLELDRVPHNFI
jgi:hypothetical protein